MLNPFYVLKLKTGETLFAEIVEQNVDDIVVRRPMMVKSFQYDDLREGLTLQSWVPFTDDEIFDIPLDIVYYMGELKEQFIKYYGSSMMREDLTKLRERGFNRVKSGVPLSDIYQEILRQVKELGEDYSIKYGLSREESSQMISGLAESTAEESELDFDEQDMSGERTLH